MPPLIVTQNLLPKNSVVIREVSFGGVGALHAFTVLDAKIWVLYRGVSFLESVLYERDHCVCNMKGNVDVCRVSSPSIDSQCTPVPTPVVNGWLLSTTPFVKPSTNHGVNDLFSNKIKAELDRSIAKHMEKGN